MKRFELDELACARCGRRQAPAVFEPLCFRCGSDRFHVSVERTSSGVDLGALAEPLALSTVFGDLAGFVVAAKEGPGALSPFYRTHSFLEARDVPGDEIARFLRAPVEERRRLFVRWKRRELLSGLTRSRRICRRCEAHFKIYVNEWNAAGFCSRNCWEVAAKSGARARR